MKCENCKHWRKIRDIDLEVDEGVWRGPHGECVIIDRWSHECSSAWLADVTEVEGSEPILITKPEFHCSLYKNKTQNIMIRAIIEIIEEGSARLWVGFTIIVMLLISGLFSSTAHVDRLKSEAIELDYAEYGPTDGVWQWKIKQIEE